MSAGCTQKSKAPSHRCRSSRKPAKRIWSRTPAASARAATLSRVGPRPKRTTFGAWPCTLRIPSACISTQCPLRGTNWATMAPAGTPVGRSNSRSRAAASSGLSHPDASTAECTREIFAGGTPLLREHVAHGPGYGPPRAGTVRTWHPAASRTSRLSTRRVSTTGARARVAASPPRVSAPRRECRWTISTSRRLNLHSIIRTAASRSASPR